MSEGDLSDDFGPFASALEGALDPIVTDFRRQMVRFIGVRRRLAGKLTGHAVLVCIA